MALIARANGPSSTIPAVWDRDGGIIRHTPGMVEVFKDYYEDLYKAPQLDVEGEMWEFFERFKIAPLAREERDTLDAPLTLVEIQKVVKEMANQKAPGPDGLPAELYKKYGEVLLPQLVEVLNGAVMEGKLPMSMTEATIIILLKEGKNPLDAASYRPISLLCTDVKILAKVLANRLKKIISRVIHADQTGFIPDRSVSMNIRRMYSNIQVPMEKGGNRAILSLDAVKAFDSLEWHYLWKVLAEFKFGPNFVKWLRLLYDNPKARVRVNGECSEWFQLGRGTRQGCPLSPLLFALALEPLAIALRTSQEIQGFKSRGAEEKVAMYADDILLFLGDTQTSLLAAMRLIKEFGYFSGLKINWDKSALLPIDPLVDPLPSQVNSIKIVNQMRYLGVNITKDPGQFITGNVVPLLTKLKQKSRVWGGLPLSVAGRCNLIKMIWMPQILFILQNSPVWIPRHWFRRLDSLFRELIWKNGVARIGLKTLRRPREEGGLALPDPWSYFLEAQIQFMRGSNVPEERSGRDNLWMSNISYATEVEAVEAESFGHSCPTTQLMIRSWKMVKAVLGYSGFSEFSPLWNNKNLKEHSVMGKMEEWDRRGIHRLRQMYRAGRMKLFQELREEFAVPNRLFFGYLQVRHALEAQFKGKEIEWSEMPLLRKLVNSKGSRGLISEIYRSIIKAGQEGEVEPKRRTKWGEEIGTITEEQWKFNLALGPRVSLSPSQGVSHLYLIYRLYYTPEKLFRFGKRQEASCQRCGDGRGDLIHMLWRCPKLHRYWEKLVEEINVIFRSSLAMEARTCLLSLFEKNDMLKDTQTAIIRCLFQGRKIIARKWQAKEPPTVGEWRREVKDMIIKEEFWYRRRGNLKKHKSIWKIGRAHV